jgi:putative GTP pyrophosphokinase
MKRKDLITKIDYSKVAYFFDGLTHGVLPVEGAKVIRSFLETENLYLSATREIATKLENLNDEFKYAKDHNPIHEIKTRVKSPKSIMDKLVRGGYDLSVKSARENLTDIAGVRVICSYIDDIYLIAELLRSQDDIEVIRISDYIKNPKPNGYRSLHLIVTVPVFLSDSTEYVKVEIQIRTIAMDFWASLEHELSYKFADNKTEDVNQELKDCADVIANTDRRMQNLYNIKFSSKKQE